MTPEDLTVEQMIEESIRRAKEHPQTLEEAKAELQVARERREQMEKRLDELVEETRKAREDAQK